ncbi:lactonase family protein [Ornithinimicrobium sp. LYQ121]|uniref:lactonase family protein n=1 Tax=Ornithinimicrobium sp. LYQ121 TaxID=3378801 RepID=UPI0038547FE3
MLYLGGYTTDQPEGSSGLARVSYDLVRGFGDAEPLAGPPDPSWLVRGEGEDPVLYAVSEGGGGAVARVRPGQGVVASAASGGEGPCHVAVGPDGRWLVVSNYVGGSIGLVAADGDLLELVDSLEFEGDGPHERQDAPHAHQAVFLDARRLLVCDLGTDRVHEVSIEDGTLRHTGDVVLLSGTGPRHLALAPGRDDLAWVVGELDQLVHVLRHDGSGWQVVQSVTTDPDGPEPEETTAGVVVSPDGSHLYVSTRGADTVSVYAVADDGTLTMRQQVVTAHWPRFVGWVPGHEGHRLLVAAEREGSVDVLAVDEGQLEQTGHSLAWAAPTCVV